MTFHRHKRAALSPHSHPCAGRARGYIYTLLFCFLMLLCSACAQVSTDVSGQPGTAASHQQSAKLITYVAIGASDTFGVGTDNPYVENWATDLADLLGPSHVHLINLGIPGITAHDALSLELPIALEAHPDLVTIWLGVNDIVANIPANSFASDLNTLLAHLRVGSSHARIAIANIPDLTLLPFFAGHDPAALTQQIQAYNAAIASTAQRYGAILVDLTQQNYNLRAHPEYISSFDGLHPTDIGYQQLAKVFYQALQNH